MYQGGANLTLFFEIPSDGIFTGTPTPVMKLNKTVSTTFDTLLKKGVKIDLDQILNTPNLAKFLDDYTTDAASGASAEEITLEDGTKEGGGSSGGDPKLFFITYGGVVAEGTDNRRQIMYGCAELTEVGGFKMEALKFSRRAVKWQAVKATKELTLVAGMFDATLIDETDTTGVMPLTLTVPEGKYGFEAWVKVP